MTVLSIHGLRAVKVSGEINHDFFFFTSLQLQEVIKDHLKSVPPDTEDLPWRIPARLVSCLFSLPACLSLILSEMQLSLDSGQ